CVSKAEQMKTQWAAWEKQRDQTKIAAPLFPDATIVKAYASSNALSVSEDGVVSAADGAKVLAGQSLTGTEIATLRRSVFYSPPPPAIAACCIPRHAFVFYRSDGNYIGVVEVCFECDCAIIAPAPVHDPKLSRIVWNREPIREILQAHGLPVEQITPSD